MKKLICFAALKMVCFSLLAQYEDEPREKFRRDNIFLGGGIGLGLGGWNGGFNVGANPEIGYSFTNWLDAGISTNVNYFSFRAEVNNGFRQRSFNYGGGVFTRLYPFGGFFVQALPEYNWIKTSLRDMNSGSGGNTFKVTQEAPSLLLGAGYGSRNIGQSNFFTVVMFDVGDNINSPYIGSYRRKQPIFRTGFNIYLRPKR